MNKSQQMRWSRDGADLLLQVRCAVYNGTLGAGFGHRFDRITNADRPLPKRHDHPNEWTVPYFAYHAVPTNSTALHAFRYHVAVLWHRQLCRRSQRAYVVWERMAKLADEFLPKPRILHPGQVCGLPSDTRGRSRVRESRSLGSVRGTASNGRSYRERKPKRLEKIGPFRCIIQLRESCAARAPAAVQPQLAVRPVRQAMLEVKRQWVQFYRTLFTRNVIDGRARLTVTSLERICLLRTQICCRSRVA
jgi:hypothetical protein